MILPYGALIFGGATCETMRSMEGGGFALFDNDPREAVPFDFSAPELGNRAARRAKQARDRRSLRK